MKIDFNQALIGMDDKPILMEPHVDGTDDKPWTLKEVSIASIRAVLPGDENLDVMKKVELGTVGTAIFKGLDLATEQVAVVKARIGKAILNSELVMAAFNAIEGSVLNG